MPNNDSKKPEPVKETKGSYISPPNAIKPSQPEEEQMKAVELQTQGNIETWQTVCGASSDNWSNITSAMEIKGYGVVLRSSIRQEGCVSEALVTIPNVKIVPDENGGKKIAAM